MKNDDDEMERKREREREKMMRKGKYFSLHCFFGFKKIIFTMNSVSIVF
jgi:hypothetical protein